jgi:hypothetical protein
MPTALYEDAHPDASRDEAATSLCLRRIHRTGLQPKLRSTGAAAQYVLWPAECRRLSDPAV